MPASEYNQISVDVVVEALVREHLSKKKYFASLQAFKAEQPQLQYSISKRSALQQILGLQLGAEEGGDSTQQQTKSNATRRSTLELWVQQYFKPTLAPVSSAQADGRVDHHAALGPTPAAFLSDSSTSRDRRVRDAQAFCETSAVTSDSVAQTSKPPPAPAAAAYVSSRAPEPAAAALASRGMCAASTSTQTTNSTQRQQQQSAHSAFGNSASNLLAPGLQPQQKHPFHHQPQVQQSPGGIGTAPLSAATLTKARQVPAATAVGGDVIAQHRLELSRAAHGGPAATAGRFQPVEPLQQQLQGGLVLQDIDDDNLGATANSSSSSSNNNSSKSAPPVINQPIAVPSKLFGSCSDSIGSMGLSSSGSSSRLRLQPLLPEQQRQLSKLLWGDEAATPDASWQQGLIFSDTPGLEWGLVQLAGGPCGVLAAVQAHLIATLMEQGLWGSSLHPEQLQAALRSSVATIIWTARSSSTAHVVMLPWASSSAACFGLCDAAQAVRLAQVATADSRQQLELLLASALPQWCQHKCWGLLLLLYSLLLTRSCPVICADMDEASSALVDSLGYCSMELVNLMLSGIACSNVFDGQTQLGSTANSNTSNTNTSTSTDDGSHVLSGVATQARVGLLTLFEWYNYVEVGQNLKSPRLPVWVVCSESHFTMLALAAAHQDVISCSNRGLAAGLSSSIQPAPQAAVVLELYDGMARQDGPIQLVLQPAVDGKGWTSKMASVTSDRGNWCGRPIPPLECVCETKWKDVQVEWRGSEPML